MLPSFFGPQILTPSSPPAPLSPQNFTVVHGNDRCRVLKAVHVDSSTKVALKAYKKAALEPQAKTQVLREAALLASLAHPNVLRSMGSFENDQHLFHVLELAAYGDLGLIFGGAAVQEQHVAQKVVLPLLKAVAYLHEHGVIHRDIKLENILVSENKTIKLADFALAVDVPPSRVGSLAYLAPEILRTCPRSAFEEKPIGGVRDPWDATTFNEAVDVWAVGIVAYELLFGDPPFEGEDTVSTEHLILYAQLQIPEEPRTSDESVEFVTVRLSACPLTL